MSDTRIDLGCSLFAQLADEVATKFKPVPPAENYPHFQTTPKKVYIHRWTWDEVNAYYERRDLLKGKSLTADNAKLIRDVVLASVCDEEGNFLMYRPKKALEYTDEERSCFDQFPPLLLQHIFGQIMILNGIWADDAEQTAKNS